MEGRSLLQQQTGGSCITMLSYSLCMLEWVCHQVLWEMSVFAECRERWKAAHSDPLALMLLQVGVVAHA